MKYRLVFGATAAWLLTAKRHPGGWESHDRIVCRYSKERGNTRLRRSRRFRRLRRSWNVIVAKSSSLHDFWYIERHVRQAEPKPGPGFDVVGFERLELHQWIEWKEAYPEHHEHMLRVAEDHVDGLRISTVFLFKDALHDWGMRPSLMLYETMVFPAGSFEDLHQVRYETREDAKVGHSEVVAQARAGLFAKPKEASS